MALPLRHVGDRAASRAVVTKTLAALALAGTTLGAFAQGVASPVGLWKTIDDETKQAKSLVRILERDGALVGRVERILTDRVDAKCEKCTDDRKDQPVLGMTIITGMRRAGDQWEGGKILDPNNGKVYASLMRLLDGGSKLEVRGYVGVALFGRSQTWLRQE